MNTSKNRIEGLSDWRVAADVVLKEKEIWLGGSAALSWTRRGHGTSRFLRTHCTVAETVSTED
jgi:hypothetical protein